MKKIIMKWYSPDEKLPDANQKVLAVVKQRHKDNYWILRYLPETNITSDDKAIWIAGDDTSFRTDSILSWVAL